MTMSVNEHEFLINHAPRQFADLVFASPRVADDLLSYANRVNSRHVLLHGPYGTGKSSTARLVVEARQRNIGIDEPLIEQLHAAEVVNINAITKSIALVYTMRSSDPEPFVIVDEVDQFSVAQQRELRALIDSMKVGSLIFTTNFLDRVDGALRDRCRLIDISLPTADQWLPRAQAILAAEGLHETDDAVRAVLQPWSSTREWLRELWTVVRRVRSATAAATPSVVPASAPPRLVVLNTPSTSNETL